MTARAEFQSSYRWRYAVIAGVCLFMAAWFAYDGFIGYPAKKKYSAAYEELSDLEDAERQERWREIAREKNWPTETPKSVEEIDDDILGQYFWAALNLIIGVPALVLLLQSRNAWVEETEHGLKTSWGQEVDFRKVTRLNKKKWKDKGIAKASYEDNGLQRVFTFDDFKYDREAIGRMLRRLEDHLTEEQIVGGPSEAQADLAAEQPPNTDPQASSQSTSADESHPHDAQSPSSDPASEDERQDK